MDEEGKVIALCCMQRAGKAARLLAASGLFMVWPAFGDGVEKARSIVETVCAGCHGMDGNSAVPTIPKLAARHPVYIARKLDDFASRRRSSDIMGPISAALNPDDFSALGVYFGNQKPTSEKVRDANAAQAGKKLYLDGNERTGVPACAGCHDEDAIGNKRFPRLAGQHREYLIDQLHKFRSGARNLQGERLMREVSMRLSDDEIKSVAEFLAGL